MLFYRGKPEILNDDFTVAIIGARRPTGYGGTVTDAFAGSLAEQGVTVISGMAAGIDARAHMAVQKAGGRTAAVLGSGVNYCYPRDNYPIYEKLITDGVVVSEYGPEVAPIGVNFPARNRIISGLGMCTAVIEANVNSGSLITAQHAMEQGRPVYAVPGNINSQFSIGCNLLIRDGAFPLVVIDDLARHIGIEPGELSDPVRRLGADERRVYDAASRYNGAPLDRLAEDTGMSAAALSAMVTVMEIKGIFTTYAGKVFIA